MRDHRQFGDPLPEAVKNKPHLGLGLALWFNAWFELDYERERPAYITRSMCFQYARDYDFSEAQRDDLWYYIRHMDRKFLEYWVAKNKPKTKGK